MNNRLHLLTLLLACCAGSLSAAGEPLRWKLQPGQRIEWRVRHDQLQRLFGGASYCTTLELEIELRVATVAEGRATVAGQVRRVQAGDEQERPFDYDTDSSASEDWNEEQRHRYEAFIKLTRLAWSVVLDDRGAVDRFTVEGAALAAATEGLDPWQRTLFSREGFNQPAVGGWPAMPEGEVAAGDRFETSQRFEKLPQFGDPVTLTIGFACEGETRGAARFELAPHYEMSDGDVTPPLSIGPAEQEGAGRASFSIADGLPQELLLVRRITRTTIRNDKRVFATKTTATWKRLTNDEPPTPP